MCQTIPNCVWKTRVPSNPDAPWSERKGWEWKDISTSDYFKYSLYNKLYIYAIA